MQNNRFDAIVIPKELDNAVQLGIEAGIRRQKKQLKPNALSDTPHWRQLPCL